MNAKQAAPEGVPGVSFSFLATRHVSFTELAPPEGQEPRGVAPGENSDAQLSLTVTIGIPGEAADRVAEVVMDVRLEPDPSKQPYNIHVVVSGIFRAPRSVPQESFDLFCRRAAPTIIWPYVRSLVSAITADARFGSVRINPINLVNLIDQDAWVEDGRVVRSRYKSSGTKRKPAAKGT